jgi:FkbM family methyltransferase
MKPISLDGPPCCHLDDLFGSDALRRCAERRSALLAELQDTHGILVYGAGQTGRRIVRALRAAGHAPLGFLDDTASKQGTRIEGLPVWSPAHALRLHGPEPTIVVAMFTPNHSFRGTRRCLNELGFPSVMSLFALAACLPQELLPFYFLDKPERILSARDHYYRLFDSLIDRRSREELVRHLSFRLYVDADVLPEPIGLNYGYFGGHLADDVNFIDGGAFDGDSIAAFLKLVAGRFSRVFAFEPDALNFRKLTAFHEALPEPLRRRVELCNAALWSKSTRLPFEVTGTLGSALASGQGSEVAAVALDDCIRTSSPSFIKYDVEGAEREALLGARRLLERGDAVLAVAVYHQPDDLWSLPALIGEMNPAYRFGLRSHMEDGTDLMLYAMPSSIANGILHSN